MSWASRFQELSELVEDVAFQSIDARLARKLLELSHGTAVLDITHQSLAVELGTAREVIKERLEAGGVTRHRSELKAPVMDRLKRSHCLDALTGQVFLSQFDAMHTLAPETTRHLAPRVRAVS